MTDVTMTLSEFLLARIAEDEAVVADDVIRGQSYVALSNSRHFEPGEEVTVWRRERVLAECEAKRRIVERSRRVSSDPTEYGWSDGSSARVELERVCRDLAAIYADHPDYRDEWRP